MAKNPIKQIQVPGTTPTTYDIQDNTFVAGTNITITDNADGTRSINAEGSDSGITEITEANTKVYTLGSGIYKLSYNGTRTIQYTSSSSDKHTVVAKSDQPVYLYVSRNGYGGATDRWEWWYYSLKIYDGVYTSGTTPKIVRYGGWSVASNGGVYDPRVEELLQSAITDTTIANRVFLSTTNNGIGKWSDGNSFSSNGFLKIGDYGVVSVDSNSYATTSTVDGKAPKSHASTATTYGVGTTSNYGHVKTQTGDLNGTTSTDGVAAGLGHTHSQYLTSHQSIKSLNTNNTTAQTVSSSEAIAGSGTINLHKVSKTGSYNDLTNKPTIPATNVIPATTTANKVLVSTTTSGTAKWSNFSTAGLLKTNTSGVISVDTTQYKKGNFEPDFSDGLQITTGDQDFADDIYVPYATTSQYGVVKIGANPSSTSSTLSSLSLNGTNYAIGGSEVTEISRGTIKIWSELNPGIYKLTYTGTIIIYYRGGSESGSTYRLTVTTANPIYMFVDQTSVNVKGWRIITSELSGIKVIAGYSMSNNGSVYYNDYILPKYIHHITCKTSTTLIKFEIINTSSSAYDSITSVIWNNQNITVDANGYYKTSSTSSVSYLSFIKKACLYYSPGDEEEPDTYAVDIYAQKFSDGSEVTTRIGNSAISIQDIVTKI